MCALWRDVVRRGRRRWRVRKGLCLAVPTCAPFVLGAARCCHVGSGLVGDGLHGTDSFEPLDASAAGSGFGVVGGSTYKRIVGRRIVGIFMAWCCNNLSLCDRGVCDVFSLRAGCDCDIVFVGECEKSWGLFRLSNVRF
jgi:hypothetical protein